jgi:hypothetical protein
MIYLCLTSKIYLIYIIRNNNMLILIAIVLLVIYIIDYQKKLENFKNNVVNERKYFNDPTELIKYKKNRYDASIKGRIRYKNKFYYDESDTFTHVESIQTNKINPKLNKCSEYDKTVVYADKYIKSKTRSKQYIKPSDTIIRKSEFSPVSNGSIYRSVDTNNPNKSKSVKFNSVASNMEKKYDRYGSKFIIPQPAGKVKLNQNQSPINHIDQIDQTVSLNIANYVNNNIQSNEIDYNKMSPEPIIQSSKSNKNRTIKDIYDAITNDNRLALQQNLDDLEAFTNREDYEIGEKYGATRFDTYSVS